MPHLGHTYTIHAWKLKQPIFRGCLDVLGSCEYTSPMDTSWVLQGPMSPPLTEAPYVRSKGRKFEKARGRRRSRGFKVPKKKSGDFSQTEA